MKCFSVAAVCVLGAGDVGLASVNLLRNPGFEAVPGPAVADGLLPSEWVVANVSPDTYSNDGSYGVPPDIFGNFSGVEAHGGIRWVAGWSAYDEQFAQFLTAPLVGGAVYTISAFLHQAVRFDLNFPGAYRVALRASDASQPDASLGAFDPTVSVEEGWVERSFAFAAPVNAAAFDLMVFIPYVASGISAYAGFDDVSLTAVPTPAVGGVFVVLGLAKGMNRRRRN